MTLPAANQALAAAPAGRNAPLGLKEFEAD
jgi:hypothetical protein